jgi:hypothetical protein
MTGEKMVSDLAKLEQVQECLTPDWLDYCVRSGHSTVLYFAKSWTVIRGYVKRIRSDVFILVHLRESTKIITRHWKITLDDWLYIESYILSKSKINWMKDGF